jgi:hypothetical protein
MEPKDYLVLKIDGDYALLQQITPPREQTILVARALLPLEIDVGSRLHWELFEYTLQEEEQPS